jgi:hypothetical protein
MSSQIFKNKFPKEDLLGFLDNYAEKKHNHYYFTKTSFKKAVFDQSITPFCDSLKEYYYLSKQKYLDKIQNYRSFVTIIRQICKSHQMGFTSKIKYDKSNYEIVYYIYFA